MRRVTLALILVGAGAMVAAWVAFSLAMTDGNPVAAIFGGTTTLFVPAVVVAAGALAAVIDRRPRGLVLVIAGACGTVLTYAVWLGLVEDPNSEWMTLAVIGVGFAIVTLSIGFVPVALARTLIGRPPRTA